MEVQLIWVAVMNKKEMISCDADFSAVGGNMMHAVISNGIVRSVPLCTPHVLQRLGTPSPLGKDH